jgi:lysophospholipase L1-like esterase
LAIARLEQQDPQSQAESRAATDRCAGVDPAPDYANVTGRPTSRFVRVAAIVSKGVASVQAQHAPYAASWHTATSAALTHPGPRWVVFGDSMSQGIGATAFDRGWVNQLAARLAEFGFAPPIVNLSASGARVPDLLAQQLPAWRRLPPAPGRRDTADLVTVLIGSNDLVSRPHRDSLPTQFAALLDQLPADAVVAMMPQPRAAARAVNVLLGAAADRGAVRTVDLRQSGASSWRGRLAADHFHPNELGYRSIADAFIGPALQVLRERGQ